MSILRTALSRRLRVFLVAVTTVVLTASGLVLTAGTASASTSYFPTTRVTTGSGTGVDLKLGVYVDSHGNPTFTKTWAKSWGSPNHRVDFYAWPDVTLRPTVHIYHPDVGTGWWEDCLRGTNTTCPGVPGYENLSVVWVRIVNLNSGMCRVALMRPSPTPHWVSYVPNDPSCRP